MKGSMRAAAAIGVGYLLGRRRKLRTATFMAVATAVGGTTLGGMMLKVVPPTAVATAMNVAVRSLRRLPSR